MLFSIEDYLGKSYLDLLKQLLAIKDKKLYEYVSKPVARIHVHDSIKGGIDRWLQQQKEPQQNLHYVSIFNFYEFMRYGMKVVDATYERCIALENIEVNVPFTDYRQPYSAFALRLDDRYREYLRNKCNSETIPHNIIISQDEIGNPIGMNFLNKTTRKGFVTVIVDLNQHETIESYLRELQKEGSTVEASKSKYVKHLERIALNMSLLLTHYGVRSVCKTRHPGKKHKNDQQYTIIEPMMQNITFYERKEINYEYKGGEHKRPHCHWRKGHWLNQVCGEGRKDRVRQFRKPVFVCASDYKGDVGDTGVNINT